MSANIERALTLAEGLLARRITELETAELHALLRDDAAALDAYVRFTDLHATLATSADLAAPRRVVTANFQSVPQRAWLPWALAASVAVAATFLSLWLGRVRREAANAGIEQPRAEYVATLAAQQDSVWENGVTLATGQRLVTGALKLAQGEALLHFDGGARVALVGPTEILLESPGAVRVVAGHVAVQAPDEAAGFRLATAEGTAVDLGTEFVVKVDARGAVECQVLDGEVEWHPAQEKGQVARLVAGEARRFRAGTEETVAAKPARFADFVPHPTGDARGELLAYEPFDYPDPMMSAERLNGGTGWLSPWHGRKAAPAGDADARMEFEPRESLAMNGLVPSQGGSLVFGAQRMSRQRKLARPVDFGADGVHYFSFLLRAMPPTAAAGPKPGRMRFELTTETGSTQRVAISLGTSFRPLILAEGANSSGGEPLTAGETVFVVWKVVTSRANADQLFLRVYRQGEMPEAIEPTHWTVSSRAIYLDDVRDQLNVAIPISEGGRFDELRLGSTWRSVVPLRGTE